MEERGVRRVVVAYRGSRGSTAVLTVLTKARRTNLGAQIFSQDGVENGFFLRYSDVIASVDLSTDVNSKSRLACPFSESGTGILVDPFSKAERKF